MESNDILSFRSYFQPKEGTFLRHPVYINNGWDRCRLKVPDGGIHMNKVVEENLPEDLHRVKKIIYSPSEKTDPNWTQSLHDLPLSKIVHSGVESFFKKVGTKTYQ